jgi:phosphatidylethanolamine N-methyltransferase
LLNIVCLSLDQDPALQPRSAKTLPPSASLEEIDDGDDGEGDENSSESLTPTFKPDKSRMSASPTDGGGDDAGPAADNNVDDPEVDEDDDDFIIMSEKQAKRIVSLTKASFDVELSMDVVIAEPNVGALARRVLGAKSLSARSGG